MPSIFEIIKRRWPEVLLVIIFQAGFFLLSLDLRDAVYKIETNENTFVMPENKLFLLTAITTALGVIIQMLFLGFLRTLVVEGDKQQQPGFLVRIGRYYFWRMLRFQIIFALVYLAIWTMIAFFIGSIVMGAKDIKTLPQWIGITADLGGLIILIKPFLLVPAVMIVLDKMVLESYGLIKKIQILKAKKLIRLFLICFVILFLVSFISDVSEEDVILKYIYMGIYTIATSAVFLTLNMGAVLFIANAAGVTVQKNGEASLDGENADYK